MKLTRYRHPLARASDFDALFRDPFAAFDSVFGGRASVAPRSGLAVDLYEDESNFYARFEVPGVKKDQVSLQLEDGTLTVEVEKTRSTDGEESSVKLSRNLSVPDTVRAEGIEAKLEDGVLTLTLPKQEERKPRTIELS